MIVRLAPVPAFAAAPLAALHRACFPADPWDATAMTEIFGMSGFFGRVAWQEEVPVGFVLALDLPPECEILSLGTLPRYRRTGIARTLLAEICRAARERRAEFAILEVAIDNMAARALYADFGFTQVGSRPKYYRRRDSLIDAVILRLSLDGVSLFA